MKFLLVLVVFIAIILPQHSYAITANTNSNNGGRRPRRYFNRGRSLNPTTNNAVSRTSTISATSATTTSSTSQTENCHECAICLESGLPNGRMCKIDEATICVSHEDCSSRENACSHVFCSDCIHDLKQSSVTNRQLMKCPLCRKPKGCQQSQLDQDRRANLIRLINDFRQQEQMLLLAYQNYLVQPIRQDDSKLINSLPIIHQREWIYINSGISNEEFFNYLRRRPHFRRKFLEFITVHRRAEILVSQRSLGRPLSVDERNAMENDMQTELTHISNLSFAELYNYLLLQARARLRGN